MALRTAEEYRSGLQDERQVYILGQRVDDVVVATSEDELAPEHRFQFTLRQEFDRDLAITKLVVHCPGGQRFELIDARQLRIFATGGERQREAEADRQQEVRAAPHELRSARRRSTTAEIATSRSSARRSTSMASGSS